MAGTAARRPGVPAASSPEALRRMRGTGRLDTAPELAVRRELHRRGLRYRVEAKVLPSLRRRADIAFTRARVVVFIDGCFWHDCPIHGTKPKANADFWADKLAANVARDRDTDKRLEAAGWLVVRAWEHEKPAEVADHLEAVVRGRGSNQAVTFRTRDGA